MVPLWRAQPAKPGGGDRTEHVADIGTRLTILCTIFDETAVRIITYNLRFGGASRSHWATILNGYDPDIFLVQETFHPRKHGAPQSNEQWTDKAVWSPVGALAWGSAVYARQGVPKRLEVFGFEGNVVAARVEHCDSVCGRSLQVVSIHAPACGTYQKAVLDILDAIAKIWDGDDLIIGGDFNVALGRSRSANHQRRPCRTD